MACQKACKQGRDDIIVKVNLQSFIPFGKIEKASGNTAIRSFVRVDGRVCANQIVVLGYVMLIAT